MRQQYKADKVEQDFVDDDGWLINTVSEGGSKRLKFNVARHAFRRRNPSSSQQAYEQLLAHPEKLAIVISDTPPDIQGYDDNYEPYACILASVCDAAGLIPKGKDVICLSLEDYSFMASKDGKSYYYGWGREKGDLYGFTAAKHEALARELVEMGVDLVAAPASWDAGSPKCRITGWSKEDARDFAGVERESRRGGHANARYVPSIDADTPALRKIAGSFAGDEAESKRKTALSCAKGVFKGLNLEPAEAVELLSYGLVTLDEAKSKSYKVPVWKKEILSPTVSRFPEFNGGSGHDDVADKLRTCSKIWNAALDAYGISFKESTEPHDAVAAVWKEIGTAIGVNSAVETALVHGVPVDDVIASI